MTDHVGDVAAVVGAVVDHMQQDFRTAHGHRAAADEGDLEDFRRSLGLKGFGIVQIPRIECLLARTICDSIMTPTPNEHTFEINRKLLAGGLIASDSDVRAAMRFAFHTFKIIIEPGAAVGISAILNKQIDIKGKTIAVFTTGGNVDPGRYCELVKSECAMDGPTV